MRGMGGDRIVGQEKRVGPVDENGDGFENAESGGIAELLLILAKAG